MPGKILIVEDNGKNRKLLVDLHGGRIWVESDFGRGSTFTFTVPTAEGICPA